MKKLGYIAVDHDGRHGGSFSQKKQFKKSAPGTDCVFEAKDREVSAELYNLPDWMSPGRVYEVYVEEMPEQTMDVNGNMRVKRKPGRPKTQLPKPKRPRGRPRKSKKLT